MENYFFAPKLFSENVSLLSHVLEVITELPLNVQYVPVTL